MKFPAKITRSIVAAAFCGLTLQVDAAPPGPDFRTGTGLAAPAPVEVRRDENYRLTAKDMVRITVFREEELTATTRISKDGTISFPLIGSAKIGGKTVRDASQ